MIKKLTWILVVSLIVSAAEIYYINSSPLLGEAEIGDLRADLGKLEGVGISDPGDFEFFNSTYNAYKTAFEDRPHIRDVNTAAYKMIILGWGILDVMEDGVVLWKIGIFDTIKCETYGNTSDPCLFSVPMRFEKDFDSRVISDELWNIFKNNNISESAAIYKDGYGWEIIDERKTYFVRRENEKLNIYSFNHFKFISKYGPRALKSDFCPCASLHKGSVFPPDVKGWGNGRKCLLMPFGWFTLAEMTGTNSFTLFDERVPCNMNISHQKFIEGYAELYRVMFARLSFVESVMDEKPPWQGIYYLAYYPYYNKIWIVTKSIPGEEIENSRILIDNIESKREVMPPFIFVDARLDEGNHKLDLITSSKTYSTDFDVDLSPFLIFSAGIQLRTDGNFTFHLTNIDPENRTIPIKDVVIMIDNSGIRKDINVDLSLYNTTRVSIDTYKEFEIGEYCEIDVSINYIIDNQKKEYKTKIRCTTEWT